jgi:ethanolamine utilization protein EutK
VHSINALGFVEVYGLVAGIEAADAMLKSARVRLLRQYEVQPGLITLLVEGDLGACRAAVAAGVAAASRIGTVIAGHVIGRPDEDTETLVEDLIPRPPAGKTPAPGTPRRRGETVAPIETAQPKPGPVTTGGKKPLTGKVKVSHGKTTQKP